MSLNNEYNVSLLVTINIKANIIYSNSKYHKMYQSIISVSSLWDHSSLKY